MVTSRETGAIMGVTARLVRCQRYHHISFLSTASVRKLIYNREGMVDLIFLSRQLLHCYVPAVPIIACFLELHSASRVTLSTGTSKAQISNRGRHTDTRTHSILKNQSINQETRGIGHGLAVWGDMCTR